MSLSQPRDALFFSPSAEMLSSQVSIPCQVVEPAHPYACCYTWNSMHLLVVLLGCPSRQADRMSLAPRPVRQHKICWPRERGHQDPQGRLMHCCDCGWTTVSSWQSRRSAYQQSDIQTDSFWQFTNLLSYGNVQTVRTVVVLKVRCWKTTYVFLNYIFF